ncbi:hypothetical protein ACWEQ4_00795 [Rhodococcus sp. NPDC003994]
MSDLVTWDVTYVEAASGFTQKVRVQAPSDSEPGDVAWYGAHALPVVPEGWVEITLERRFDEQ